MKQFTIQRLYHGYYSSEIEITAHSLDEALDEAMEFTDGEDWKHLDHDGDIYIGEIFEHGETGSPSTEHDIPDRLSERGEAPLVTLQATSGGLEATVEGGTVRIALQSASGETTTARLTDGTPAPGGSSPQPGPQTVSLLTPQPPSRRRKRPKPCHS